MSTRDGSGDDMNESFSKPGKLDDNTAERLLSGQIDAADAPPGYAGVAAVFAAASSAASETELSGEESARAMFRAESNPSLDAGDVAVVSLDEHRSRRVSRKAVLVGVVAGVILASTGVAAAGGDLPEPVQRVAHQTLSHIGVSVPDARPKPEPAPRPANQRPNPEPKQTPSTTTPPARRDKSEKPPTTEAQPTTPPSTVPVAPTTPPTTPPTTSSPPSTVQPPPSSIQTNGSSLSPNAGPITPTDHVEPSSTRGANRPPTGV